LVSGTILWLGRTERGAWSTVHTESALVLAVSVALHVAVRAWRTTKETAAEVGRVASPPLPGRVARHAALMGALVFGLILATTLTAQTQWPTQPSSHTHVQQAGP